LKAQLDYCGCNGTVFWLGYDNLIINISKRSLIMSDDKASVYHIVAFTFEGKDRGKEVVKELKKSDDLEGLKVINSVLISRDEVGKVKFSEIRGMSTKKGLGIGASAGVLLGIIGSGGLLLPVVAGGAAGGVLAKRHDKKVLGKDLSEITDLMENDSSAILALLEDKDTEKMIDDMSDFNANVVTLTLGDEESGLVESMMAGEFEIVDDETND
jgi:uncharacterized membrane protein